MSNPLTITNISDDAIYITLTRIGSVIDEYECHFTSSYTWQAMEYDYAYTLYVGESLQIRAKNEITGRDSDKYIRFIITGNASLSGNINSMITPDFEELIDISAYPYAFISMFANCPIVTVSELELPATTLSYYCYEKMFYNCANLTAPVALPAKILKANCYYNMFSGCTNIKLSDIQTYQYVKPYRIPSEGTGVIGPDSLYRMFYGTGGQFKSTPELNRSYYLYKKPAEGVYHWNGKEWSLDGDVDGESFNVYYQEDEPTEGNECDLWVYKEVR